MERYIWDIDLAHVLKPGMNKTFNSEILKKVIQLADELTGLVHSHQHSIEIFQKIIRMEWEINLLLFIYEHSETHSYIEATEWCEDIHNMKIDYQFFHEKFNCLNINVSWLLKETLELRDGGLDCRKTYGI